MLPPRDQFRTNSPRSTPPSGKRSATIKGRIYSFLKQKQQQQCRANMAMENMCEVTVCDPGNSALVVERLKEDLRQKLMKPIRLLRTATLQYANVELDGLANAHYVNEIEMNCAFLWAAFTGDLDLLHNLECRGADVNFVYPVDDLNALHLSSLNGSVQCTQWLLTKGCKIVNTVEGNSPLHYAVLSNSQRICRYLIESGCRIDVTALHAAVQANSLDCLAYLLELPVCVNAYDHAGMAPLHIAADIGNVRILRQLLSDKRLDVNLNTKNDKKYTALHLAAENGYTGCLKMLLENGAKVDEPCSKNQTPLYLACKYTFVDCVSLLLEHGAAVKTFDSEKRTPLHASLSKSPHALHIVQRLIDRDADIINEADAYGYTALHIAALNELDECVEYLIAKGANVAAKTRGHVTALNIMNRKTPLSCCKIFDRLNMQLAFTEMQSLKFDFRDIITNSNVGEVGYLYTLQKENQANILEHPLCEGFLHLKWQKIRFFVLLRVGIGLLTVCLLSIFVLWGITNECYNVVVGERYTDTSFSRNTNASDKCSKHSNVGRMLLQYKFTLPIIWYLVLVVLYVNCIRLLFTLMAYRSAKHFISKYSNILEITVTICIILLLFSSGTEEFDSSWTKALGSLTILFSWAYVMVMVSQLPSIGTYVAMFNKVLKEFLKMIVAFLCLLMGFTFTFCVLRQKEFKNPVMAFAKIVAMMTGELNIDDLIEQNADDADNSSFAGDSITSSTADDLDNEFSVGNYVTVIVLCLFTIIITIVLMNLLVGIAVNDVEGLRKTADLSKLIQQTKLIHFFEKTCFRGFLPGRVAETMKKFLYVFPDSYTVVIYVRPLSPHEKRLPSDVMERGLKIAVDRVRKRLDERNREPSTEQRIHSLESQIVKLQDLVVALQKTLLGIASNNVEPFDAIKETNDCDNKLTSES